MREPIRDKGRLEHIVQSIDRVERFMKDKTFKDLIDDDMRYFAVIKNIEIIGEAAYKLTNEFKANHPQTDWKVIMGMRNYIVHGYYDVDENIVFDVVKNDLPILKQQILDYLSQMD